MTAQAEELLQQDKESRMSTNALTSRNWLLSSFRYQSDPENTKK